MATHVKPMQRKAFSTTPIRRPNLVASSASRPATPSSLQCALNDSPRLGPQQAIPAAEFHYNDVMTHAVEEFFRVAKRTTEQEEELEQRVAELVRGKDKEFRRVFGEDEHEFGTLDRYVFVPVEKTEVFGPTKMDDTTL